MKKRALILCAVDLGESSRGVFAEALALARARDAELLVIHAVAPHIPFNHGGEERAAYLSSLRESHDASDVDLAVRVQHGKAADVILLHARARLVDLIVLGANGGGIGRGRARSLVEDVVREAPCPTLVIPANRAGTILSRHVLCAVDFSRASDAAMKEALWFAQHAACRVTLFHVVNPRGSVPQPWRTDTHVSSGGDKGDPRERAARRRLEERTGGAGRPVSARVSTGDVVTDILEKARAVRADLLVLGARRRSWLARRLWGSIASLLHETRCPVLAVPPRERTGWDTAYRPLIAAQWQDQGIQN